MGTIPGLVLHCQHAARVGILSQAKVTGTDSLYFHLEGSIDLSRSSGVLTGVRI